MNIRFLKSKNTTKAVILAIILLSLPVALFLVKQITKLKPEAQVPSVSLSVLPSSGTLDQNTRVQIFLNPNSQKIVFVRAVIVFDKAKLSIAGNADVNPAFNTPVVDPNPDDAQITGRLVIVQAVNPTGTPVSTGGEFAGLNFNVLSTVANDPTAISLEDVQVVDENGLQMNAILTGATFTLNPLAATATRAASATVTARPATSTPTPTQTPTPTTGVSTATLNPTADAFVNSNFSGTNYGTTTDLKMDANPTKTTYIKFGLSSLSGRQIISARLRLKTISDTTLTTKRISFAGNSTWSESTITYRNQPGIGTLITTFSNFSTANTYYEVDITNAVASSLASGTLSLAINSTVSDSLEVYSKEASAGNKPELVITYR